MDVIYFLKALLKKKWLILFCSVLAVLAAFFFTMNKPRLYVSTAQMATGLTITDQIRLRDDHVNIFELDQKFESLVQTVNSPIVISQVSYDLIIHDLTSKEPFRTLTEAQLKSTAFRNISKEHILELCRRKHDSLQMLTTYKPEEKKLIEFMKLYRYDYQSISKQLTAARLQRTDYIDLTFRSEHPELSAYVVNTLYTEFIRFYRGQRSEMSVENVETFAQLVEQKKRELDDKIENMRAYKAAEGILNVAQASGSEVDLIKQFEKNLFDERANINNLQASLRHIDDQLRIAGTGKPVYSNQNNEILLLRRQLNTLNEEYLQSGVPDKAKEEKIKALRLELQEKMDNAGMITGKQTNTDELTQKKGSIEAQISAASQNAANLESRIRTLKGSLGSYASKEAMVSSMQEEVTMAQEDYNKLKEKLNAAIDNRAAPQDHFKQSLVGQPAINPESSKRLMIMGLSGISVFFLTALGILFLEFIDTSLKSPSIFERTVDLKLISTINHTDLHRYSILEILQKKDKSKRFAKKKRQNTFRELLRKLRYEVEHSGDQIFLFTSTDSQQGKTTLVQALAYSLSLSNRKVLIIDTNFCNNDLTMQLEAMPTLETFSIPPERFSIESIRDIVTTYAMDGVEVIGCKGGDYTPAEILPPNHLLHYLNKLTDYYDYILLEGAPLNDYTDSKELVDFADKVIAVFSSRTSLNQTDRESIHFLQQLDGKFLGAVLNNIREDYLEL